MEVKEIECKSCLTPCGIEGIDYAINPYIGCQHSCNYCYADFMKRFTGHSGEDWGQFVDVRTNIAEVLAKELEKKKPGSVWLSSVTDCYQPLERKFQLTKGILEAFAASKNGRKFELQILTKSSLVERDFGVLKELNAEVGLTVNTLQDKCSKAIEPFASPASERIRVLKKAKKSGLKTYAFFGPVLPGITDLEALFSEMQDLDFVFVEMLNTKPTVLARMIPLMKKEFPEEFRQWNELMGNPEQYYESLKKEATRLEKQFGLKVKAVIKH
ncbi:MAG: radical SAM protein [Candidatus Diapherotrites archaeon]|nr:radical SAM protein [Candidatus Diapherotrites archaeon]